MAQSKGQIKSLETYPKEMEIWITKEFKITLFRLLNELYENTDKSLNSIKKRIHEQNKNTNKETMKKDQTEILN